jgi:phosphoribosylanthranilate isomerase
MGYHLRVKICGVTTEGDARQATLLGADAIGLNFYPRSPRYIDPDSAPPLLRVLPPFVEAVGIFVERPLREVFAVLNVLAGVRTFQWYGANPELCDSFPFRFLPAFPVRDEKSLLAISRYLDMCRALGKMPAAIVVDAASPEHGGTGLCLPWNLLVDFRPGLPLILAGGLTAQNVGEAVRLVRPYAVDVASGVESSPGRKDPEKMRRFIGNAREAAAKL